MSLIIAQEPDFGLFLPLEYEPHREKTGICICENKGAGNREADQRLIFTTRIVQSLYLLNPKFQASSYLKPGLCKVPKTESLIFAQEPDFGLFIVFVLVCFFVAFMSRIMREPDFAYAKTKAQVTAKLISIIVFATRIVQSLYLLNPKVQASSYLLYFDSPVWARPGLKSRRRGFLTTRLI